MLPASLERPVLNGHRADPAFRRSVTSLFEVEELVGASTASWHQSHSLIHDRRSHRFPFEQTMCIVGLNQELQPESSPVRVQGRDISIDGISFRHHSPISAKFISVTYQTAVGPESLIVKLSWCRFGRDGQYVSGGRFVREAPVPAQLVRQWDELNEA